MGRMTTSKIRAFFREFPFLNRFLTEEEVWKVSVSRVSPEAFDLKVGSHRSDELLILLDKDGRKIIKVGVTSVDKTRWYHRSKRIQLVYSDERVHEAIERFGRYGEKDKREIHFILYYEPYFHELILMKSPRDYSLQGWLEEVHLRDAVEAKAIHEEIDRV